MFSLDFRSKDPIYTQIEKNVVNYINLGIYEKDSMLPSVRVLACELGVNPNTVAKAYRNLEQNGVIYTVGGKGVFVKGDETLNNIQMLAFKEIKAVLQDAKNSGIQKSEVIKLINKVWESDSND